MPLDSLLIVGYYLDKSMLTLQRQHVGFPNTNLH
jgi:hypothetical protein